MKNNSKFKRIIAGFLCAVLSLGALPMSAFAFTAEPGKTCEAFYGHKYTGSDGNTYHSPESYQAIHYDTAGNQTVRSHNGGGARATLWLRDDSGERQVMCIESGVDYGAYENYESVNGKNSAYFQNLPATAQYGIMLASIYGWAPDRAVPVSGCNEDDFSIATQTIYWEYQQLLKDENTDLLLPHFSCHSLRHTFTTRMCEAGVNVKVIQDTLGHKDISTTLNIYTDVTKELKRSEFEGLDLYFKAE